VENDKCRKRGVWKTISVENEECGKRRMLRLGSIEETWSVKHQGKWKTAIWKNLRYGKRTFPCFNPLSISFVQRFSTQRRFV